MLRGRPTCMICAITNGLEADPCPIFSIRKSDVAGETSVIET